MKLYLGTDTSNYTTSFALCTKQGEILRQVKQLLPVSPGELGLRQSDAVFHHTKAVPALISSLMDGIDSPEIIGVGCSEKPRPIEGSYMPCFLVGVGIASAVGSAVGCPVFRFSHQEGHLRAAAYSAGFAPSVGDRFFAFHLSGGTTDLLLVTKTDTSYQIESIGGTNDLNAGQVIDRVGRMLGLSFPAGRELEVLAAKAVEKPKGFPVSVTGLNCNLSGLENLAKKRMTDGDCPEDVAAFTFAYLEKTLLRLIKNAKEQYGDLPFLFAGGVMSSVLMRPALTSACRAFFADGAYSADNACGIALLTKEAAEKGVAE